MKKKVTVVLATLMTLACATSFIGCGQTSGEQKVMNVSLNPEVEFVLDADDKVVSVNALNEEGNLVVSAEVFTGKTAEEAAKLFVEVSKETGFLVSGSVNEGENKIEISFSGDATKATKLYNDVKAAVDEYLTTENVTATIERAEALTEEYLEGLVAECAPYLDEARIQAMGYGELLEELVESRTETAGFYSQELKNAYYEAKTLVMEKAELQAVKVQAGISGIAGVAFDTAFDLYESAVQALEDTRMTYLVNEDSVYQLALEAFREAKTDYLNYRNYVASLETNEITSQISAQLESFQTVVDDAEAALVQAGVTANNTIDSIEAQLETAYNGVVSCIQNYAAKVSQYASQIATKQNEAMTAFFTAFETEYEAAITAAENNWSEMKSVLEQGYTAD